MAIGSHKQPQREMLVLFNMEMFSSSTNHNQGGARRASLITRIISSAGFNYSKQVPCIRVCNPVALVAAGAADPCVCPRCIHFGLVAPAGAAIMVQGPWLGATKEGLGRVLPLGSDPCPGLPATHRPRSCSWRCLRILRAVASASRLCLLIMGKLLQFWQEGLRFPLLA